MLPPETKLPGSRSSGPDVPRPDGGDSGVAGVTNGGCSPKTGTGGNEIAGSDCEPKIGGSGLGNADSSSAPARSFSGSSLPAGGSSGTTGSLPHGRAVGR